MDDLTVSDGICEKIIRQGKSKLIVAIKCYNWQAHCDSLANLIRQIEYIHQK